MSPEETEWVMRERGYSEEDISRVLDDSSTHEYLSGGAPQKGEDKWPWAVEGKA